MKNCCVKNCPNATYFRKNKRSMFEFPSETIRRQQWFNILKKYSYPIDLEMKTYVYVCEDHFTQEDIRQDLSRKLLKKDAVPSVFNGTHLKINRVPIVKDGIKYEDLDSVSVSVQIDTINWKDHAQLTKENEILWNDFSRSRTRNRKVEIELDQVKKQLAESETVASTIRRLIEDASENDQTAVSLLDQIINYKKSDRVSWSLVSESDS